jgi:hypothetical protein
MLKSPSSYDYSKDIAELENVLEGLYADVLDDLIGGVEKISAGSDPENRDKVFRTLTERVSNVGDIPIKASLEVDPEVLNEFGVKGFKKSLPFLLMFTLAVGNAKTNVLRSGVGQLYAAMRVDKNKRSEGFRKGSKQIDTNRKVFDYARGNLSGVPDKVVLEEATGGGRAPFSLKIGLNFSLQYQEFNRRARDFLFGKDFQISTSTMTENLKKRLQATLASGYALGDGKETMVNRVKQVLGDRSNASTIAITEIAGAANYGEYEFAKAYREREDVEIIKTWWQLPRTTARKTHKAVAGMSLKFEEKYHVDGEPMERPHDPNASSRNIINCACYLTYDTGKTTLKPTTDERGVRRFIDEVENTADPEPFINAERVGAFVNDLDAIEYIRDVYGIVVDDEFYTFQYNEMADLLDSMPYQLMMDNLKLTSITAGKLEDAWALYSLANRQIMIESMPWKEEDFREAFAHELGHSLHYSNPDFFRKFAEIAWKPSGKGGQNLFANDYWIPTKGPGAYGTAYASTNAKEHFAEMVRLYTTQNTAMHTMAAMQSKMGDDTIAKIIELFDGVFGPARP